MDDCLRGEGPRGGAWREEVCVLELEGNPAGSKDSRTIVKFVRTNKIRNECKGRCCFNSECGKVYKYKLTTNR